MNSGNEYEGIVLEAVGANIQPNDPTSTGMQ
jgi:hypothetical protein